MTLIPAFGDPPPPAAVGKAVDALRGGDIVALPTDTVYGLAADPYRTGASDRLFRAKGRPRNVELPVLVADIAQALELCVAVPDEARRLMDRFWPGPLTLVLPRRPDLAADLGEDDATIGIRCPDHPVPRAVCAVLGPVATTSANRHGEPPLTTAAAVSAALAPAVEVILDAGPCDRPPSTVVDATGAAPRLLRQGALSWEDVVAVAGGGAPVDRPGGRPQ